MAQSLHSADRSKTLKIRTDADGATYLLKPNGKKHYYLTTAITANVTLDDAATEAPVAGDTAETSHATGIASLFVSDGTKWQFITNA
jgi:hypothetical protein